MKTGLGLLLMSSLCAGMVMAEDLTTTDGTVYKDFTIVEKTPIGLSIVSGGQAGWVDFRDLPPAVAQKYGYNAAQAAAFEKSLVQNQGVAAGAGITTPVAAAAVTPAAATVTTPVASSTVTAQSAGVVTPVASTTVSPQTATVVTPVATTTVNPQTVSVMTPVATATVSSAPGTAGISVTTPVASVTVGAPPPAVYVAPTAPPPQTSVIVINSNDPIVYDPAIVVEPVTTVWVLWNGRYYPRGWWNYWYWHNRYVMWNGRYYPAHYFNHGGVWHGGRFVPYRVDPRRHIPAPAPRPAPRPHAAPNRGPAPAPRGYTSPAPAARSYNTPTAVAPAVRTNTATVAPAVRTNTATVAPAVRTGTPTYNAQGGNTGTAVQQQGGRDDGRGGYDRGGEGREGRGGGRR